MKTTHIILAAVLAASSTLQAATAERKPPAPLPEFKTPEQLAKWRQDRAKADAAIESTNVQAEGSAFFTGKPYLSETETYSFLFRNYDPELTRWTTTDPSGFPDGANNIAYMATPTSELDWQGLFSLNTTRPSVSTITDQAAGSISAFAWDLQHVTAGSSAASIATGLITQNTAVSNVNLSGSVDVSNFFVQNHSSSQTGNNPNVASVSLTLQFQNAPSGFGWIQIYRKRPAGTGFNNWQLDISSGGGPAYTSGPVLVDVPAVGIFSHAKDNGGDGGEMQIYTFAAVRDYSTSTWTLHDGIFWGGHVHE